MAVVVVVCDTQEEDSSSISTRRHHASVWHHPMQKPMIIVIPQPSSEQIFISHQHCFNEIFPDKSGLASFLSFLPQQCDKTDSAVNG